MSEANTQVASTSSLINQRSKLIKYDTKEAEQQTQSTDNIEIKENIEDARSEEKKATSKPTIFAYMTKEQATEYGALDLFNKYDSIEQDNVISTKEYAYYKMGKLPTEKPNKDNFSEEYMNTSADEQFRLMVNRAFKEFGIDDEITTAIDTLKNGEKQDSQTLVKEQFGVDLSQYKTEEEKLKAFQDAINTKYGYNLEDKDSIYAQHYERLKKGEFTVEEKDLHGTLNEKQLEYYAQLATQRDAMVDLAGFFAESDIQGQKLLVQSVGALDKHVQTGIIGAAILSADDKETRHNFALLIKDQDLNLTDNNKKLLEYATIALGSNLTVSDMMEMISRRENFDTASAQTQMFKTTDSVERAKVSAGIITQEQYDQNYATVYAGSAYKLEEASEAYKYVIDNANDNNRTGAMNTLASNAYKIENSTQRDGAINNLQSSKYYSADIMNTLDKAYVESQTNGNYIANVVPNQPVSNPMFELDNSFMANTDNVIENGTEAEISQHVRSNFLKDNSDKGTTPKRHKLSLQQGMYILSKLISQGKIQNSAYESFVLNKLSALPPQTLVNMYLSSNQKVQAYFDKNSLVSPLWVAMNAPDSAIKNMNETMQEKIHKLRGEEEQNKVTK